METITISGCEAPREVAQFLERQRLDGVTFRRGRWFWQPLFTVTAPAWRMPSLKTELDRILEEQQDRWAW